MHQRPESRMVETAAIRTVGTSPGLYPHNLGHPRAVFHRHSHTVLIVIDEQLPYRPPLSAPRTAQSTHPPILSVRNIGGVYLITVVHSHIFRRTGHHGLPRLTRNQRVI